MEDTGERLIPEGHTQTLTYGEHLSRYLSVVAVVKGKTVLDIASGAGYGTKLISKSAKKVYGIDYSLDAINYAKEHYSAQNIEYKQGDAQAIPLPDNSVDIIVSFETIEHLKKPTKFIEEVKRVLKKDGQFIVSTPNDDEFIEGNEFHLHEFQFKELKKIIHDNFKYHRFYYQSSYFSAALLDETTFTKGGRWSGTVEKTFPQDQQKAVYYIAVSSNSKITELSSVVTLADAWSTKDDIVRDTMRREEVASLIQRHKAEQTALMGEYKKISTELTTLKTSKAWKAVEAVRKVKTSIKRKH